MKERHFAKIIRLCAVYIVVAALAGLGWLYSSLPERICVEPGRQLELARFKYIEPLTAWGSRNAASTNAVGSYQTTLSLGGILPIKTARAVVMPRMSVTVCGTPFGIKMFSEGALIVGFSDILAENGMNTNPAKEAGLHLGDRVIRVGETETENNDAIHAALEQAAGQEVTVVYVRNGEQLKTTLRPVWDANTSQWRAGMWVRDSSAGVGTLTFVSQQLSVFAGLGHSISDGDTGQSIALRSGEIVACEIVGCTVGQPGSPGELKGRFVDSHAIGTIIANGENGVYGSTRTAFAGRVMEVAFAQEVAEGEAQLWTTVEGETAKPYTVQIEKISDADPTRNLVIRVTDPELLAKTGGIVQGMSGSPIVQNGRLVGAVTHVLVNEPTRGYAIFAETMLLQAQEIAEENLE